MAGQDGSLPVVDVVAMAKKLIPPPEPALEPVPETRPFQGQAPRPEGVSTYVSGHRAKCPLGHDQPAGVKFCGECGMDMSAPPPGKVSLEDARPRPAELLTAEERAERDRQHAEALAAAVRIEQAPDVFEPYKPESGQTVIIHFIEDGFTFAGKVWYRGEEIEIGPDHPRWPEVRGWILLDKWKQFDRYGKQYFDRGPWPGRRSFAGPDVQWEKLSTLDKKGQFAGPTEEELRRAEEERLRRGRAVPAPLFR